MNHYCKASLATAALLLAAISPAHAVSLLTVEGTNAVGNCQAALPSYEGMMRKRPLALVNEGTATSFVTCAYSTNLLSLGLSGYTTKVTNYGTSTATVACTGVTGEEGSARYVTKSVVIAPGAVVHLDFSAIVDNLGGLFAPRLSMSCALPVGTGLNHVELTSVLSIL